MEPSSQGINSKPEVIDYCVNPLARILSSENDAQMYIYHASCDSPFGFCCDFDEDTSGEVARLSEVLSVRHDPDYIAPGVGVVTKAQMVDYYAQALTKVFGNEKHAQMCIYQISWQSNFRFCCDLDDEIAWELAGVLGVLSVLPDKNFESKNKDYGGLSFYTSEKTLRTASEGFGELVEGRLQFCAYKMQHFNFLVLVCSYWCNAFSTVNIIVDKISKRSKGYAFIEYATEEAASTALRDEWQGYFPSLDYPANRPPKLCIFSTCHRSLYQLEILFRVKHFRVKH
ncbi:hypothetical protein I3760_04G131200 [Carya illinoinensis]|nr:hypothetical protein I3760_04G131200 [Carya illinoinensis]